MKIGLVGYGYWGKIIHKNLDWIVNIYDPQQEQYDSLDNCSHIFIATPVHLHFQLCQKYLNEGKDVFCEKTLTGNPEQSKILFSLAREKGRYLFVNWIFLYNEHVKYIKQFIDNSTLGKLKSVSMNRLNMGPVRTDVNARTDLAVHDLSILDYLLCPHNVSCQWIDYQRNPKGGRNDSCIALLKADDVFVQINSSWHYGQKDRLCIFEFEAGFLLWNDITQTITVNGNIVNISSNSPLQNSIDAFLLEKTPQEQIQNTTLFVEDLICK